MKTPSGEDSKNTLNIDFLNKLCSVGNEGMCYEQICEEFNINKRTAQRWISTVTRLFPNYLMVKRTKRNKYFKVDFMSSKFTFDFSGDDAYYVGEALELLSKVDAPNVDKVRSALKGIYTRLEASVESKKKQRNYQSDTEESVRGSELIKFRGPHFSVDANKIEQMSEAIKKRRVCEIFYKSAQEASGKLYLVAPIGFLYGQSQYLVAKEVERAMIDSIAHDSNQVHLEETDLSVIRGDGRDNAAKQDVYRFFKISNVVSCAEFLKDEYKRVYHRELNETTGKMVTRSTKKAIKKEIYYSLGENETVDNISYYCFGIFRGLVHHIKWRFDAQTSLKLDNYLFVTPSDRQKVSKDDQGRITVEFDACGVAEMHWFLQQFRDHVEVLEPVNWKEIVQKEVIDQDVIPV